MLDTTHAASAPSLLSASSAEDRRRANSLAWTGAAESDASLLIGIAQATRAIHPGPDTTVEQVMQLIAETAVHLIPGARWATVATGQRRRRTVRTTGTTHPALTALDRLQQSSKEGPALDALWEQSTVQATNLRAENRWGDFSWTALTLGARSLLAVRLTNPAAGHTIGALTLYADRSAAFTTEAVAIAEGFAVHAAIAVETATMKQALRSRDLIGQAKGILMERHRMADQQAFDALVTASQKTNRPLHDVADHLILTGDLPTNR